MIENDAEPPIVSLAFRCVSGLPAYLEGAPAGSLYTSKRGMMGHVEALIEEGRLTTARMARPRLLGIRGGGGFYVALIDDGSPPRGPKEAPMMQPLTAFDEERLMLSLMREGRCQEFARLTGPRVKLGGRAVVMLDRGRAMAGPWALWGELPKHRAATFLADACTHMFRNSTLLSFASTPRWEREASRIEPDPSDAAMGPALAEACLVDPQRLVVVTDGHAKRPAHAALLTDLAESGVRLTVIVVAGAGDAEGPESSPPPGVLLHELKTCGDLARFARGGLQA